MQSGNIVHLYQHQLADTYYNLWWALLPFSSLLPVTDSSDIFGYGRGTGKRLSREATNEGPREAERGSYPRRRGFSRCGRNMLALREVWDVHHCSLLSHDLIVNLRFHGCFSGTLHPAINLGGTVNIYFKRKHVGTAKPMKCWTSSSAGIN